MMQNYIEVFKTFQHETDEKHKTQISQKHPKKLKNGFVPFCGFIVEFFVFG